jgi:hypothetical protein
MFKVGDKVFCILYIPNYVKIMAKNIYDMSLPESNTVYIVTESYINGSKQAVIRLKGLNSHLSEEGTAFLAINFRLAEPDTAEMAKNLLKESLMIEQESISIDSTMYV